MKRILTVLGVFILAILLISCDTTQDPEKYNYFDGEGLKNSIQEKIFDDYAVYRNVPIKNLYITRFIGEYNDAYIITIRKSISFSMEVSNIKLSYSGGSVEYKCNTDGTLLAYYDGNFYSINQLKSIGYINEKEVLEVANKILKQDPYQTKDMYKK